MINKSNIYPEKNINKSLLCPVYDFDIWSMVSYTVCFNLQLISFSGVNNRWTVGLLLCNTVELVSILFKGWHFTWSLYPLCLIRGLPLVVSYRLFSHKFNIQRVGCFGKVWFKCHAIHIYWFKQDIVR